MTELKLTQIWIYPIKSLGGISLSSAQVMPKGLQYDRRWMLVDDEGVAKTQRVFPKMALFKLSIDSEQLTITYANEILKIDLEPKTGAQATRVTIWDDTVSVFEVDQSYSRWFSNLLGTSCRLVFFPEEHARPVDPKYNVNDEHVSLAD